MLKVSARRHLHPSSSHGRYDVYRNGGLYVFDKSLRDVTCIHRPHKEDTTSHHNGGLYVFDKICATSPASIDYTWKIRRHIATEAYMLLRISLCDVTCIHRLHMEDTTSHRNGGLTVFEHMYARRHLHTSTPHRRYDVTSQRRPICFSKCFCATSPASIDYTWEIQRHNATEAYMF